MSEYVVELKNATKRFPGVVALKNMSLAVKPGEILGLIGENGAGKSTLIKVLTGVHQADEGQIFVNGQEMHFKDPNDSAAAGIACVYQELNIEKLLSVTDNIFINKWIKGPGGLLDYPTMHKKAKEVMASLGQDIDPTKAAGTFGMGVQQMIEIAKAVLIDAKMIIMDEPTSSLGEKEVEQLMTTCRDLRDRGIGIVFVSHKLEELFELCDRVTVMRDGEHIWTKKVTETDNDDLIAGMVATAREMSAELGKLDGCSEEEANAVSTMVGLGALKYFILKVDPRKTMLFDPRESIDFNGNTGPFIQYTHARICSILRKATEAGIDFSAAVQADYLPEEIDLVKTLTEYPSVVAAAGENFAPSVIGAYVYELAKQFNGYYHDHSILREEDAATRTMRLRLAGQVARVIRRGMNLLGIDVPERM